MARGSTRETPPYTALAAGYDLVMDHVDYDGWARYVHMLIRQHQPSATTVLELGCGTGTLALALQPMGAYDYRATDGSREMVAVAAQKAAAADAAISVGVLDFTHFEVEEPVDVVLLLYDGLNYLLEIERVEALLAHAYRALRPGGIFIVDQSTPANSESRQQDFEDENEQDGFHFRRTSSYDPEQRLHTTRIDLWIGGRHLFERHVQRAYVAKEVAACAREVGFRVEAAYDNFTRAPADADAERVHWVLRRPLR